MRDGAFTPRPVRERRAAINHLSSLWTLKRPIHKQGRGPWVGAVLLPGLPSLVPSDL